MPVRGETGGLRVLVVYYSFAGHTRMISELIARMAGADLEELHAADEPVGTGMYHYLWSVRYLFLARKPRLAPLRYDPAAYDLIMIGSPVLMGSFAPAVRSYIATVPLAGRTVALFCSYNSSPGPSLKNAARLLPMSTILGTAGFVDPGTQETKGLTIRVQRWLHDLETAFVQTPRSL